MLCKKAFEEAAKDEQRGILRNKQGIAHGVILIERVKQATGSKSTASKIASQGFLSTHRDKNPFIHSNMCLKFAERRELLLKVKDASAFQDLDEEQQAVLENQYYHACRNECLAAEQYIVYFEAKAGL